jgi:hypothetical protein
MPEPMPDPRPYENKAHRTAKLIISHWPGWKNLREKLQYVAFYKDPNSKVTKVYAYTHSPMRSTGWMELFQYQKYFKIEGLFEANGRYQTLKKQGKLTEYGTAPSLRGPRPSRVKSEKNEDVLHEDEEVQKQEMGKEGEKCCVGTAQRSIFSYLKAAGAKEVFDFEEPEETEAQKVVRVLAEKYQFAIEKVNSRRMWMDDLLIAPLLDVGRLPEKERNEYAKSQNWRKFVDFDRLSEDEGRDFKGG